MRSQEFTTKTTETVLKLRGDRDRAQKFIDSVYERYPQTWQNNHAMIWGEGDNQELALFELVPHPGQADTVEVKWFQAYPLRRGVGSRAMRELQRLAQEAGVNLSLYVWDKGQVSAAQLTRFYRAMGFQPTQRGSRSMTWSAMREGSQGMKFLRPGELRGSYTDAQLQALGFRRAQNGAWFIPQHLWQQLTQSGQLREQQLDERVSTTLYHYTNISAALKILQSGQFELSSTLGTDVEAQYAPKGYPYFLSATRTRTGGYHDHVGDTAVMFVLDGDWFNSRYPGGAVDYWGNRDPRQSHHRAHEAEDRIFSRDRSIPIGGVRALHVLAKTKADPHHLAWARQLIIQAKQKHIPVYLYDDEQSWRQQDTRHTVKPSYLRGQDLAGGRGTRGHRGYLMPWMELLRARDQSQLSKRADSIRYNLAYDYNRSDAVRSLSVDLSNARKPNSGPDREHAVKIIDFMRRKGINSVKDLADYINQKWNPGAAAVAENFADGRKPGTGVVRAIREVLPLAQEIWFHGSRAIGKHRPDSDTDILVVVPDDVVSDDYIRVVRVLQNLSKKFSNYDIQPTKAGYNIHRIAHEEGKLLWSATNENFADGKKPGRRGLSKRMGVPTKASVSKLRKIARSSSGEKQRMAHWLANMKSGRARKNK